MVATTGCQENANAQAVLRRVVKGEGECKMKCPKCNVAKSTIRETRKAEDAVYRYRICLGCGNNYKSKEVLYEGIVPRNRPTGHNGGLSNEQQGSGW